MKILFDCFSCSPYYGSDEGIGWLWPYYMRKYHEVWALVRKDRREDIEKYCSENNIKDIHFIYCDIPDWMNFYYKNKAKNKNGVLDFLLYQWLWQYPALKVAKRADKEINFDIIHHVSTNDFRLLGRLYKLNKAYIIGPIGGAQETPEALREYVQKNKKSELLRSFLNKFMTSTPGYKRALNKAAKIYFSNTETFDYLKRKINDTGKCGYMTEIGCSALEMYKEKDTRNIRTFMWAGRMEYRKGLEFLFDVIEGLPKNNSWRLVLCGDGTQKEYYQYLCNEKGLDDYVTFTGKLSYEDVIGEYNNADVFVFPSLRETTGTVIVEAMSKGTPVICLNQGGAKFVLTDETGYLVDGANKEEFVENFRQSMFECINNPDMLKHKSYAAYCRIRDNYTWEKKVKEMLPVYAEVLTDDTEQ
ncbi:MAG: glycosyltransferase family 4 protein [Clostridia bacterium]